MKQQKPRGIQYRIYISESGTKFYLRDIIIHANMENYFFDTDVRYAKKFPSWSTAMKCREGMVHDRYDPHIEQIS